MKKQSKLLLVTIILYWLSPASFAVCPDDTCNQLTGLSTQEQEIHQSNAYFDTNIDDLDIFFAMEDDEVHDIFNPDSVS